MQWNQIKTLFIICFLLLDIYLVFQFVDKEKSMNIGLLEHEEITTEQRLAEENISYQALQEVKPNNSFLSVKPKTFTKEDLKKLKELDNQEVQFFGKHVIYGLFDKPIHVHEDTPIVELEEILKKNIIFADEYTYGDWDQEKRMIMFFQKKNNWPVYFNQNGIILFFLNNDNQIISYIQTMLGEPESSGEKKSVIKPLDAIEKLYENNKLITGDEITKVNLGYHTLVPLANGVQVFIPIWKVLINDDHYYFVDAIEGIVYDTDEQKIITGILIENINRIQFVNSHSRLKEHMLDRLKIRLLEPQKSTKRTIIGE